MSEYKPPTYEDRMRWQKEADDVARVAPYLAIIVFVLVIAMMILYVAIAR